MMNMMRSFKNNNHYKMNNNRGKGGGTITKPITPFSFSTFNLASQRKFTTGHTEEKKEEEVLALPPGREGSKAKVLRPGESISFEELGPIVIREDGSMGRLETWADLTDHERANIMRVLPKRNQQRRAKLLLQQQLQLQQQTDINTNNNTTPDNTNNDNNSNNDSTPNKQTSDDDNKNSNKKEKEKEKEAKITEEQTVYEEESALENKPIPVEILIHEDQLKKE